MHVLSQVEIVEIFLVRSFSHQSLSSVVSLPLRGSRNKPSDGLTSLSIFNRTNKSI